MLKIISRMEREEQEHEKPVYYGKRMFSCLCAANRIRTETDLLIDTYHVRHLVFDFTETEFMDSSGIGVIIGRCKNLGYSGGDVSACHLNERVDKIFTVSGLKKIIQVKE